MGRRGTLETERLLRECQAKQNLAMAAAAQEIYWIIETLPLKFGPAGDKVRSEMLKQVRLYQKGHG